MVKIYDMLDILGLPLRLAYVVRQHRRGVLLRELAVEFEVTPSSIRMWELKAIDLLLRGKHPDPDSDLITSADNALIENLTQIFSGTLDSDDETDAKFTSLCAELNVAPHKLRQRVWQFADGGDFEKLVRFAVCWDRASRQPRLPFPKAALLNERIDDLRRTARGKMLDRLSEIREKITECLVLARAATDDRSADHPRSNGRPSDDLHPILWCGRQWAVTTFGVEKLDGGYYVAREKLVSDPYMLEHVAKKPWCDVADFADAYLRASVLFAPSAVKVAKPAE